MLIVVEPRRSTFERLVQHDVPEQGKVAAADVHVGLTTVVAVSGAVVMMVVMLDTS